MQVRSALDVKGPVIADVSANSGPSGRDAFHIVASPDNDAGVIVVNKPKLAIWSTTQNNLASIESGDASVRVLTIRGGSDIIEKVISTEKTHPLQPGEVVIVDENNPLAARRSTRSYQKQVIGVVSGAGGVSHGLSLQQEGVLDGDTPVAVAGRVKVKVVGDVQPGDLLTTSSEPGKAMKAKNIFRKNGAIIGKALSRPDAEDLVLMLVNLQ